MLPTAHSSLPPWQSPDASDVSDAVEVSSTPTTLVNWDGLPIKPCPIVICGYDELTKQTLETLMQFGQRALVVDEAIPDSVPEGFQFVQGKYSKGYVLRQVHIQQARVVLLLRDDDQGNFQTALLVRDLNPKARIISRLFNHNLSRNFDQHIPNHYSLSTASLAAPAFGLKAVSDEFVGYFALPRLTTEDPSEKPDLLVPGHAPVAQFTQATLDKQLRVGGDDSTIWNIIDLTIAHGSRLLRTPLEELEQIFEVRVLFHYPVDKLADFSKHRVFEDFDHRAMLSEGDRVVLLCSPARYSQLLERNGQDGSSRAIQWASGQSIEPESEHTGAWFDRARQLLQLKIEELNPLTRFLSLALAALISLGITIFSLMGKQPADSLFLTITVLNGGYGDINEFQDETTNPLLKLVAVALMLVGTVFVGLVYGFVTDKLLSSRFGVGKGAPIPKSGHIVLIRLSRLSYRILQLLRQMQYEVLVIDSEEDNPLIEAARQEGVAIMTGDHTLPSTLNQARVETSRCLVCATEVDLANVETALTAQTLNAQLRTILRVSDPGLADRMQRHFPSLGISYSPARLAAPAFATAALVGQVYGTISWDGRILISTLLEIASRTHLIGITLRQLSQDYDFAILVLQPAAQEKITFPRIWEEHGDIQLAEGDRLYVIGALESLARLARRRTFPAEVYRVRLLAYHNPSFESGIIDELAFYSRHPKERIRPALRRLPRIVSPPLTRDKALKLARQLKKMDTQVEVIAESASIPTTRPTYTPETASEASETLSSNHSTHSNGDKIMGDNSKGDKP